MRFFDRRFFLALGALFFSPAFAEDLGQVGPVYEIREESALDTIMRRLREKERSGELKRIQQEAVRRSVASIKNPRRVEGLTTVRTGSSRLLDPTVTYDEAVKTDEGRIVVPAGSKVNPLLFTALTRRLVFFDGTDSAQVEAVGRLLSAPGARIKPILVAGSWFDMSKAWKKQVYFDQKGTLSERFGIRAVPTVISQDGNLLRLDEIPAKELK